MYLVGVTLLFDSIVISFIIWLMLGIYLLQIKDIWYLATGLIIYLGLWLYLFVNYPSFNTVEFATFSMFIMIGGIIKGLRLFDKE